MPRAVVWILLVGAALRIIFFVLGENNGGDALARAAMTAGWLQHPEFRLNFEPWLPVHFWLMAGMSLLVRDPGLGARVLSLVLGVASLIIFWRLAKEIFGEAAAILSLLVFALYSLHIAYSTTSSSEVPYLFFLMTGLLSFFVYRRSRSLFPLGLAAGALGISAGMRYEAWICISAVFLILLLLPSQHTGGFGRALHVREVLLFGAVGGGWPLFWIIYQWKAFAKPLYGVTMNYGWVAEQVALEHRSMLYRLALPPGVILLTLSPLIVAASFYGLALGLSRQPGREFALIVGVMGAVYVVQTVTGGVLSMARYTITLGALLAIASGFGLERIARSLSSIRAHQFRAGIACLLALNLGAILVLSEMRTNFSDKFSAISPRLRFPHRMEQLRDYLKPRLKSNDALIIDDYNVESNIIAAAIGLPFVARDRMFLASSQPVSDLSEFMEMKHPRYLIYSDRGVLPAALPLPEKCLTSPISLKGMKFSCLFENDIYRIYEVSYSRSQASVDKY